MNDLERAVLAAAEFGGSPERIWQAPETADVRFSDAIQHHPFDGVQITHWIAR